MDEPAQFRVLVAPTVRDRFKVACLTNGVTMSDQAAHLINGWLTASELERLGQHAPTDEPQNATNNDVGEATPENDADILRTEIATMISDQSSRIVKVLGLLPTRDEMDAHDARQEQQDRQRHDSFKKAVGTITETVSQEIANSQEQFFSAIETRRRDWYWLGGAATLGFLIACALLWLVAGAAPGRSLAVRMTGAETSWQAARLLAGSGSLFHSELMAETKAMLDDPNFREQYGHCIDRAKASTRSVRCVLNVAPLVTRH
jgi:hypothetical protein